MNRNIFAQKALDEIPKILTLQDRNPHSPTYGCFDRNHWHYKIIDFPSGMSQEFVWPLALAWKLDIPQNKYFGKAVIKEWVKAGILFALKSSHKDGSCDDYYPFEKASGAAAFSLLAFLESYKVLGLNDPEMLAFFKRRADWLGDHMESGQLSNHQALISLCLELAGKLLKTQRWEIQKNDRINKVLSWQDDEGWFQEYEGFDPGYHTLTLLFLAWLYDLNPEEKRLKSAISRGIDLAAEFIHPDGTFGGEYGSRNTNNFFSYGFECAGKWNKKALQINDNFSKALESGKTPCYSDDHILGHHAWNYFLTFLHYVPDRPSVKMEQAKRVRLENGKILIERKDNFELFAAMNKGGVFKLFHRGKLICSDTGFSIIEKKSKHKNCVAHLVDDYEITISEDQISVKGALGWAKHQQMTAFKLIILRVAMFSVGRFFPDLIRKMLQILLITGKKKSPYKFNRTFLFKGDTFEVIDKLYAPDWNSVKHVGIGCDQTSIYVVMSRTFHEGNLREFIDLDQELKKIKQGSPLIVERVFHEKTNILTD